jgi:peptidoglycan/xylan/chitin deacetylase (PgdA/CDA1 family)
MRKRKSLSLVQSYKKHKEEILGRMRLFLLLCGLLSIFIGFEKAAYIKDFFTLEKVFALQSEQEILPSLSPTPSLSDTISTPSATTPVSSESPIFDITTITSATPTPTPTIPAAQPQEEFCLDVPMLIYHHVQPLDEAAALGHAQLTVDSYYFEEQMKYLVDNGYHTISSDQVVAALQNRQQLPEKSIVVTLDDGYDDWYTYVFPIAKKYNVTIDLMIPPGLINTPGYLTWEQLKEMSAHPLFHIYNHTLSHASLGETDRATIEREVMIANAQLEETLGKKINIFVFPYGEFGPTAIEFLKEKGFVGAISTIEGTIQCDSYIMTLHRTHIGNAPLDMYGF